MLEAREPACEPRHRRRDDEGGELVALDVVALEAGALLVLADCRQHVAEGRAQQPQQQEEDAEGDRCAESVVGPAVAQIDRPEGRSEEHTSELQSLMRISYAVFCLNNKPSIYGTYHHRRSQE